MTQHGGLYQAPPEQPAAQVVEQVAPVATYTQGAVPTPVEQEQVVETVVEPVVEQQQVEQQAPEPQPEIIETAPVETPVETPVEEVTETVVVAETEAPAVQIVEEQTEAPIVEEQTQAPVIEETQAPIIEETPAPVVEQAPVAAAKEESTYDDIVEEQPATATEAATEQVDTVEETNEAVEYADEEGDEGNCDDPELRAIVEAALKNEKDNLEAARKIEGDASAKFGGRFNAIVSDAEFAYVNWYGKRNCQLRYENRHSLTWED